MARKDEVMDRPQGLALNRAGATVVTDKPKTSAAAVLGAAIRRARTTDTGPPSGLGVRVAVEEALRALDRLERTIRVRPGDDPRVLGLVRGAKDAVRAVGERSKN